MISGVDYGALLDSLESDKFRELWSSQNFVLSRYAAVHGDTRDLAVELPTGGGKTLIALLIAESWRRHSQPAAILSANKTLARQMKREADALGIPAVLMEGRGEDIPARDKRAYQRASSVAIMNYWVYFNQNPAIDPAGLLIMDDAHLAEHCLNSLYSCEIDKVRHAALFKQMATEILSRFPDYTVLADALTDAAPGTPPELMSFIDQYRMLERLREQIDASPLLTSDADLRFRWHRIRPRLAEANVYLGTSAIWIRPYIYPLTTNEHYAGATQCLYMSATIGDPGDLARRLGTRQIQRMEIPPEHAERTSGRRLILMNRSDDEQDLPARVQSAVLAGMKILPKSVWLCSSEHEARRYQSAVAEWLRRNKFTEQPTWLLTSLGDEIDQFKAARQGHLFVAGRFDGMDFNADECRMVVLTTLPRAINTQEEFIAAYLGDAGFIRRRLNQRIVQALGRCNRTAEDFGVYILGDRRFSTHFSRDSNKVGLAPNLVAELDYGQDSAELAKGALVGMVQQFLGSDFRDFDQQMHEYGGGARPLQSEEAVADSSTEEVEGWTDLFERQNYGRAAKHFTRCRDAAVKAHQDKMAAFYEWMLSKALYLQAMRGEPGAYERALRTLEDATVRGGHYSWFNRLRTSLNRERNQLIAIAAVARDEYPTALLMRFDELLEDLGATGLKFQHWLDRVANQIDSDSHAQFQDGMLALGKVLGYTATRPKNVAATDCQWKGTFGNQREVFTFEAKIEHQPSSKINVRDVGQAHVQVTRARAEFGRLGYEVRGTIVTHLNAIAPEADTAAGDLRIIAKKTIMDLWIHVTSLLSQYRDHWSLDDLAARTVAAGAIRQMLPSTGWLTRVLNVDSRFVDSTLLLHEWPSVR